MSSPARTPAPPYYAVIFTSVQTLDLDGYAWMAERMEQLASEQPGFLGIESARRDLGITVSYWRDLASIQAWKQHVDHRVAQKMGKERWYQRYAIRIARVEAAYEFLRPTMV
ncbi:MAG: antibiotic biosynthesis monooxygenase [Planctomycetes bacterium]|nr:antibiotic biosynthesis monooxygenase [Planctomycetota bacterium]